MQTNIWGKKILVTEASNQEKMWLRKNAVGLTVKENTFVLDDTLINRILLGLQYSNIIEDKCAYSANISAIARDYQRNDIERMLKLKYVLNRNKPGYGKTFEAIEYCRIKGLKRILVICPKSVTEQWRDQFSRWWPEVEGMVCVRGAGPKSGDLSIFVTNYEQLTPQKISGGKGKKKVLMPTQVWLKCKQFVWDIIIVDESHRIKNASAQVTQAIKDLPSRFRMCLTGTPILGHPDDLWSQLQFLCPEIAGNNYWNFVTRFCEIEDNSFGKKIVGLTPSEGARELLTKLLNVISVGGQNHKVTQGKNIIPIELTMDPAQRNLYKDIVNLALDSLEEKGVTVKNAMDQIIKQQQVTTNCCKESFKGAGCKVNPKFDWIQDWLEDNEGEKLVVFSKFAETAEALYSILTRRKAGAARLYIGSMSATERANAIKEFVNRTETRAIIGTIGAMGTGVDGLQHVCRDVVFLDRDWTPGLNEQAEDRVNRSGQEGMTNVWILNMKHSIDEYVEQIQNKKASDIEEVFRNVATLYST